MEEGTMRDHRKLEIFGLADSLALQVYNCTKQFPDEEKYGLTSQMLRASVSVAANIVEGAAKISTADFIRMLVIAYGSACELDYELSLAARLGYLSDERRDELSDLSSRTCRALRGFINAVKAT
jgi:four helix bundle protein